MYTSSGAMVGGAALLASLASAAAVPVSRSATLVEADTQDSGSFVWLSRVTPTIFGQNATNYDYYLASSPATDASDTADVYAQAVAGGNEEEMVNAFLNATMVGTMTAEHASDMAWKCAELGEKLASSVSACQGQSAEVHSRSQYQWVTSKNHVPSSVAVSNLITALNYNPGYLFPSSPRSYCNKNNAGTMACLSWSKVASFQHSEGVSLIQDAQSVVNFDTYSAQTNNIPLSGGGGVDFCVSNRADGCT